VKQQPTNLFIEYLESLGLVFIRKDRWHHDLYDYPDGHVNGKLLRCPAVRTNYKEIPLDHISTNLKCVGKTKKDFEQWLKTPNKAKKSQNEKKED
jgi:hypothetical protein